MNLKNTPNDGVFVVNTGIVEVTPLLNEAHAENPHHRSLRSQSKPRLICIVRHTKIHSAGPRNCYHIHGQICVIVEFYVVTIYLVNLDILQYLMHAQDVRLNSSGEGKKMAVIVN